MELSRIREAAQFGSWQLGSIFFFSFLTRIVVLRFGVVAFLFLTPKLTYL